MHKQQKLDNQAMKCCKGAASNNKVCLQARKCLRLLIMAETAIKRCHHARQDFTNMYAQHIPRESDRSQDDRQMNPYGPMMGLIYPRWALFTSMRCEHMNH
eukprot:947882-Karenia_brevis.AAC.1